MTTFEKAVLSFLALFALSSMGTPVTVADALVHSTASAVKSITSDPVASSTSQAVPMVMDPTTEKNLVDQIIKGILGN